eukprot:7725702-Lingulodinium_polyedra.AAC.1
MTAIRRAAASKQARPPRLRQSYAPAIHSSWMGQLSSCQARSRCPMLCSRQKVSIHTFGPPP